MTYTTSTRTIAGLTSGEIGAEYVDTPIIFVIVGTTYFGSIESIASSTSIVLVASESLPTADGTVTSIRLVDTLARYTAKLTTPQIIDVVRLHHPNVSYTMLAQLLSTAQAKFIRATKLNAKVAILSMSGKTVVGMTRTSPLVITSTSTIDTWNFYKDATIDTIKMNANFNVLFYTDIICHNSVGSTVDAYAISINDDGSVLFYDSFGTELADFDSDVAYLYIYYVGTPGNLAALDGSTPELVGEYHEALAHYVISDLYMTRTDMPMLDRLQASKHYRNLYDDNERKAAAAYNMQNNLLSVRAPQTDDFAL